MGRDGRSRRRLSTRHPRPRPPPELPTAVLLSPLSLCASAIWDLRRTRPSAPGTWDSGERLEIGCWRSAASTVRTHARLAWRIRIQMHSEEDPGERLSSAYLPERGLLESIRSRARELVRTRACVRAHGAGSGVWVSGSSLLRAQAAVWVAVSRCRAFNIQLSENTNIVRVVMVGVS